MLSPRPGLGLRAVQDHFLEVLVIALDVLVLMGWSCVKADFVKM